MATNAYSASVPVFQAMFANVSACLDKAAVFAAERGLTDEQLLAARLYPDMLPLSRQIQIASDTAKGAAARLAGEDPPSWPDVEATLDDLKGRIARTVEFLAGVEEGAFRDADAREVTLRFGPEFVLTFTGEDYLRRFALPNFYFHCTTAYAILRHIGVPLGKRDFLGG